ncbi:diaminopimelate epimerase [Natranaerobius trueperi]|uniref:Diaminopimelate epimerase n=1 Tax=Natranaerobius trueperi TaxID=759412 RepID=A0A226BX70_9FIRM|nr:diaminopimelate epimerase [Natranaerobius trueperi]OWZ83596.1 diaminopimelate epimerase [Natranaerobius trueperi]
MNFSKMTGLGNDFIIIDEKEISKEVDRSHLAKKLCDRRFGIGADGLMVLSYKQSPIFLEMYNSDGSQASTCGNALRCIGKYLYETNWTSTENIEIDTTSGIKNLQLETRDNKVYSVTVNMGVPIIHSRNLELENFNCVVIDIGNLHSVIFTPYLTDELVLEWGPEIEKHSSFENGVNVNFVHIQTRKSIRVKTWERGAGKTLACGSGASASMVAAFLKGEVENKVMVNLDGGTLEINLEEQEKVVKMKGGCDWVFHGKVIN